MGKSIASIALIRREAESQTLWLAQWNEGWRAFNFVGGHKHDDESFRECVSCSQRPATADSGNAGWQRDLWVSCWRMGVMTEQMRGDARPWWQQAYDVLSGMQRRGLFVSAQDEEFLAQLKKKLGQ